MEKQVFQFAVTPVVNYDKATNSFWGFYQEFPEASAVAESEGELLSSIANSFLTMFQNEPEVRDRIISAWQGKNNHLHTA
jgi:predicted RNase H-like HicB family nuclease